VFALLRRLWSSALFSVLFLSTCGLQAARAGTTIDDIVKNNGGVITVGQFKFTFNDESVSGDNPNGGMYTNANIEVTEVSGGLQFTPSPMLTIFTKKQGEGRTLTIKYKVMGTGEGITGATLSFTPGQVEIGGTSEVTESILNESLHVFRSNDQGVITEEFTQSVSFANNQEDLDITDVARVGLGPEQQNGRMIQLLDLTNTFAPIPEPSTLILACTAIPLAMGCWWHKRKRAVV
jgi:hypothetical protein